MEKFLKKVKDFEEALFVSSEYAEDRIKEQMKKFKLGEFNSNIQPYKDNEPDKAMEDEIKYNKNNSSKKSFKGEFKDCVQDLTKVDVQDSQKDEAFINSFNLRDAMIAKEILDKPICKRRRTRGYRGGR